MGSKSEFFRIPLLKEKTKRKKEDLTGKRFGRLIVVEFNGHNKYRQPRWLCKCDCGNTTVVTGSDLRSGATLSCGCYRKDRIMEAKVTHGMSYSNVYPEYNNMKRRCYNENAHNYKHYGGRGIKICDRWLNDIHEFYNDVSVLPNFREEGYTLDRINNDGDYEPGNVRWATRKEQSNNRRPYYTCKNLYEYDGKMRSLKEISDITGISRSTLNNRILKGWEPEKAFNTEVQEKFRHKSKQSVRR